MKKDFKLWNTLKEEIHHKDSKNLSYKVKEIWFCSLGANVGYEQDGKNYHFERPVLIFKKFNNRLFWGIPITSKIRKGKYYFTFKMKKRENCALLQQIRLLDSKRLRRKTSILNPTSWNQLLAKFKRLLPNQDKGN